MAYYSNGHEPEGGGDEFEDLNDDLNGEHDDDDDDDDEEEDFDDDIWDQIIDPNFGNNENNQAGNHQAAAGNYEIMLQDLILGNPNLFGIPHNPQPMQLPDRFRNGSATPQPASSSTSDAQSSVAFNESEVLAASSPPIVESGGCVNEAYQTDSSELSEFVASTESQKAASLTSSNEACFKFGSLLEIPRRLEKDFKSTIQALRNRQEDDIEKRHPNPPNTPASVAEGLSDRVLDTSPTLTRSPSESLRTVIKTLNSRLQGNRETNARSSPRDIMAGTPEPGNMLQTVSNVTQANDDQTPRDDPNEENIQISTTGRPDRADNLFMQFGSFMVLLVLLFPLAIVACLQGLLPKNYITGFLVLLIMSFIGALYCFIKACRKSDEETPDEVVRYGSILNSNPDTSDPA